MLYKVVNVFIKTKLLLLLSCILICVQSNASESKPQQLHLASELSNINSTASVSMAGAFGERISYNTGGLSFSNLDVSIPGAHALPVSISRVYIGDEYESDVDFRDWQLDIPYGALPAYRYVRHASSGDR